MKGRDTGKQLIAGKYELLERAGEGGMAVVWHGVMHGAATRGAQADEGRAA